MGTELGQRQKFADIGWVEMKAWNEGIVWLIQLDIIMYIKAERS